MVYTPRATAIAALVAALLLASRASVVSASEHVVGGDSNWSRGVNYTSWANNQSFYLQDWLVFFFKKGEFDVVEVNKTAYENCNAEDPIVRWSRGHSYAVQLNRTGDYYFICDRGDDCKQGMRFAIKVLPSPPALAPAPAVNHTLPGSSGGVRGCDVSAVSFAVVFGLLGLVFWG